MIFRSEESLKKKKTRAAVIEDTKRSQEKTVWIIFSKKLRVAR